MLGSPLLREAGARTQEEKTETLLSYFQAFAMQRLGPPHQVTYRALVRSRSAWQSRAAGRSGKPQSRIVLDEVPMPARRVR